MVDIKLPDVLVEKILRISVLEEVVIHLRNELAEHRKENREDTQKLHDRISEIKLPCEGNSDCPSIRILKEGDLKVLTWKTGLIIAGGGGISTLLLEALKKKLGF